MHTTDNQAQGVECNYSGRHCNRARSIKSNGQLHRFCVYHRERANLIQRRTDARKRSKHRVDFVDYIDSVVEQVRREEAELERQYLNGEWWMSDEETAYLSSVLFDHNTPSAVYTNEDMDWMLRALDADQVNVGKSHRRYVNECWHDDVSRSCCPMNSATPTTGTRASGPTQTYQSLLQ